MAGTRMAGPLLALSLGYGKASVGVLVALFALTQVFSWLSIAPAVSTFVAPFTAGLLIDHAGYRAAFLLLALLPVVAWIWVRTATELPSEPANGAKAGTAWSLWREPGFRRLLLMN